MLYRVLYAYPRIAVEQLGDPFIRCLIVSCVFFFTLANDSYQCFHFALLVTVDGRQRGGESGGEEKNHFLFTLIFFIEI